jgi:hypothetical protein
MLGQDEYETAGQHLLIDHNDSRPERASMACISSQFVIMELAKTWRSPAEILTVSETSVKQLCILKRLSQAARADCPRSSQNYRQGRFLLLRLEEAGHKNY